MTDLRSLCRTCDVIMHVFITTHVLSPSDEESLNKCMSPDPDPDPGYLIEDRTREIILIALTNQVNGTGYNDKVRLK